VRNAGLEAQHGVEQSGEGRRFEVCETGPGRAQVPHRTPEPMLQMMGDGYGVFNNRQPDRPIAIAEHMKGPSEGVERGSTAAHVVRVDVMDGGRHIREDIQVAVIKERDGRQGKELGVHLAHGSARVS
jgi:hypothetical protein